MRNGIKKESERGGNERRERRKKRKEKEQNGENVTLKDRKKGICYRKKEIYSKRMTKERKMNRKKGEK